MNKILFFLTTVSFIGKVATIVFTIAQPFFTDAFPSARASANC